MQKTTILMNLQYVTQRIYRMISAIPLCMDQQNLNFDSVILSYSISHNSLAKPLCGAHK
jgi:hypothetical protein